MATSLPDCIIAQMKAGVAAHKTGSLRVAEDRYKAVLSMGNHPGAAALLANVLLARASSAKESLTLEERVALRATSLPYARQSIEGVDSREVVEQKKLLARYAYYLLAYSGLVKLEDSVHGEAAEAGLPNADGRSALLKEAIGCLYRVTTLDPSYFLAWRNLGIALTAADRHEEAEGAMARAVITSPTPVDWDLYYKHGKCLKRVGKEMEALGRYGDAVEASEGKEEVPLFWLRVALAGEDDGSGAVVVKKSHKPLPPPLATRLMELVGRFGGAAGPSEGGTQHHHQPSATLSAPPNSYIRKLFDRYAPHFDKHLVEVLGYKTPTAMRALALEACGMGVGGGGKSTSPPFARCADLGCGTGLAGVAFRDLIAGDLDGCDLSPAMVVETEKRGIYREVSAEDVVVWLGRNGGEGGGYDLVLCADVVVYIGDLEPLMRGVVHTLREATAAGAARATSTTTAAATTPPPIFVFSTEALLGEGGKEVDGGKSTFRLTPTGRCQHDTNYIKRLAGACGLKVVAHRRENIRENAGVPVVGDLWVMGVE